MAQIILHLPHWLATDGPSVLDRPGPAWQSLVGRGEIMRLRPTQGMREAAWLGLDPERTSASEGVLTVAALGADPPPRSVHFAVNALVLDEGQLRLPATVLTDEERRELIACAQRLNTSRVTFVAGIHQHGLVWEDGSSDMFVPPPNAVTSYRDSLPQGDGEPMLRRWIDDAINLLRETEFNRVRAEEGIETIEVLWPWGQGFREALPSLALRFGAPVQVVSGSMRVQGLARLCGARHGDPGAFGRGTSTRLEQLTEPAAGVLIGVVSAFAEFDPIEHEQERWWLTQELEHRVWAPLGELDDLRLMVTSETAEGGLVLQYDARRPRENSVPFAERVLDDRTIAQKPLHEVVA
jgi:2,3-bisphosphoglycerate-independent phosphoglycerate mutase